MKPLAQTSHQQGAEPARGPTSSAPDRARPLLGDGASQEMLCVRLYSLGRVTWETKTYIHMDAIVDRIVSPRYMCWMPKSQTADCDCS